MTDQGEGTCPLCMQEMDLTDQQLKPCKCGYEVCVWCWHHILETAEKDNTEGRCPACRNPYDKERIMAMTISRERLAAVKSVKKQRLQKEKPKTLDISEVSETLRVIRRNLVYVAGIPIKLADEKTLRKKEFFGQYGKVSRIVIPQAPGGIQNVSSSTSCCVFVTFSKVEEALRCIQVVNGYTLAGSPLKACFGATRYCQAWLKNLPCRNPNCIYLHDAGSEEDTCTKDEVYTACVSKLQQYTGMFTNNFRPHSGSCLPPPLDKLCNHSDITNQKPLVESIVQNPPGHGKIDCSNIGGKSDIIPAATSWSSKGASGKPSYASVAVFKGPSSHPSVPSNALSSYAGVEAHVPANPCVQCSKQTVALKDNAPLLDRHIERFVSCKPYDQNGYRKDSYVSDVKAGVEINLTKEFISSHSFTDSSGCFRGDKVKLASLDILHSMTNRSNSDNGSLGNNTNDCFSPAEWPCTPSVNLPNIDTRIVGSRLENYMGTDSVVYRSREDGTVSDKAGQESREESIVSDILPLISLDDHIADLHSQTKLFNDTNKRGGCSNMNNSSMACNSNESSYSFVRMDDASHTREKSLPFGANGSGLKKNTELPDIVEKYASQRKKSFLDFNAYHLNNSDVLKGNRFPDDRSQLLSTLHQSVAPVSKPEVPPACRHTSQNIAQCQPPPGFPPQHPADYSQLYRTPSSFGSSTRLQFSQSAPYLNSSQQIAENSSYTYSDITDLATDRGKLQNCTQHQISMNWRGNLITSPDIYQSLTFQDSGNSMDQRKMKSVDLQEANNNYNGLKRDYVDSSIAGESGIVGRSDPSSLTETNSGRASFSNSRFGFLIPSPKRDESKSIH